MGGKLRGSDDYVFSNDYFIKIGDAWTVGILEIYSQFLEGLVRTFSSSPFVRPFLSMRRIYDSSFRIIFFLSFVRRRYKWKTGTGISKWIPTCEKISRNLVTSIIRLLRVYYEKRKTGSRLIFVWKRIKYDYHRMREVNFCSSDVRNTCRSRMREL